MSTGFMETHFHPRTGVAMTDDNFDLMLVVVFGIFSLIVIAWSMYAFIFGWGSP